MSWVGNVGLGVFEGGLAVVFAVGLEEESAGWAFLQALVGRVVDEVVGWVILARWHAGVLDLEFDSHDSAGLFASLEVCILGRIEILESSAGIDDDLVSIIIFVELIVN